MNERTNHLSHWRRTLAGFVAMLVLTLEFAAPLLHTHSLQQDHSISQQQSCPSCAFESTLSTPVPDLTILPEPIERISTVLLQSHTDPLLTGVALSLPGRSPPASL